MRVVYHYLLLCHACHLYVVSCLFFLLLFWIPLKFFLSHLRADWCGQAKAFFFSILLIPDLSMAFLLCLVWALCVAFLASGVGLTLSSLCELPGALYYLFWLGNMSGLGIFHHSFCVYQYFCLLLKCHIHWSILVLFHEGYCHHYNCRERKSLKIMSLPFM